MLFSKTWLLFCATQFGKILKVTKFQLSPPTCLDRVVKTILERQASCPLPPPHPQCQIGLTRSEVTLTF